MTSLSPHEQAFRHYAEERGTREIIFYGTQEEEDLTLYNVSRVIGGSRGEKKQLGTKLDQVPLGLAS